ncbi:MAG: AI-2E family transporter [Chloroflexota bacterium]|nr:AI-2E family transporter [Chloroflexota bacterium]
MTNQTSLSRTLLALITIAVFGLVLGFMKVSAGFINALLLSWIIVLVASPLLHWLKRKMPTWLAFVITLVSIFAVFLTVGLVLVVGINRFIETLPAYTEQINNLTASLNDFLVSLGFNPGDVSAVASFINPEALLDAIGNFLASLIGTVADIVLIILLIIFLLLDALNVPEKLLQEIQSGSTHLERLFKVSGTLRNYVLLTTVVGLATGLLDTVWFFLMGVEFAILWGTLAFLLSYIPSIGFWLAAIPPTILALLESGPGTAVLVFLGIVLINGFAENVVKPKYMGEGVNLSPFMIVFSVIFWAAILGPLGAILGVPVTILFKETVLEGDEQNRWIARLMSSSKDIQSQEQDVELAESEDGEQ